MKKLIQLRLLSVLLTGLLVLLAFTSYSQFSTQGNLKSIPDKPWALDVNAVPWLPFSEDWSSGLFETNLWDTNESNNWRIAGQVGCPAPAVEFYSIPAVGNYQEALTSNWLSGRDLIDGNIYLSFDLKHTLVNVTGTEFLKVQICSDTIWNTVISFSNISDFDWISQKLNLTEFAKGSIFKVRFMAEGVNSADINNWLIDNILIFRECLPPLNLTGSVNFPNIYEVLLSWEAPGTAHSDWIQWDNGINDDAIGLTGGGTFSVASRFTSGQLIEYAGSNLTRIKMFPYGPNGTIVLKVWQGANAEQLLLSQPVESYIAGEWNEFALNTPVPITGTTELWFGYTVTNTPTDYVAGCDAGPANAGFGDMISLDGTDWESGALAFDLNYNWNLHGLIMSQDGSNTKQLTPLAATEITIQKNGKPNAGNLPLLPGRFSNEHKMSGNRQLLRYDVFDCYYNEPVFIGSTTDTSYIFEPEDHLYGYCYVVSAVYTDCEAFSDEYALYYPKTNSRGESLVVYPVPSENEITVSLPENLTSLEIFNFSNIPVLKIMNLEAGDTLVNVSTLQNGIYFIRGFSAEGSLYKGKFIVSH